MERVTVHGARAADCRHSTLGKGKKLKKRAIPQNMQIISVPKQKKSK